MLETVSFKPMFAWYSRFLPRGIGIVRRIYITHYEKCRQNGYLRLYRVRWLHPEIFILEELIFTWTPPQSMRPPPTLYRFPFSPCGGWVPSLFPVLGKQLLIPRLLVLLSMSGVPLVREACGGVPPNCLSSPLAYYCSHFPASQKIEKFPIKMS